MKVYNYNGGSPQAAKKTLTTSGSGTFNLDWRASDSTSVRWLTTVVHDKYINQFSYNAMNYQMTGYVNALNVDGSDANGWANGYAIAFGHQSNQPWARSSDVVYHEYTHNVIYNLYGSFIGNTYGSQGSAMDEGLADYFACTFNNDAIEGEDVGVNRNLNNTKRFPNDYDPNDNTADPHMNGLIISGACWSMRQAIGSNVSDNLVFTALQISPHAYNFNDFLSNILIADYSNYGATHHYQIRSAFNNHGITAPYSGSIISSTTWFGNCNVVSNVSVNSGVTLTLNSGTVATFASGASLIVNGTLNAAGTLSSPVVFDFISPNSSTQNGMQFNSGSSSSTISYCRILNAYRGIYENGVSVNVSNSSMSNCTNGMYLYSSSPTIYCNNIHNNSYGIYLISSSPLIENNYIQTNSLYGVYCTTSSNPNFGYGSRQGLNYISNNSYGVFCWNNSIPMLGNNAPLNGGYNDIETNTTYNVYNMSSGSIYAIDNWWGTIVQGNFKIGGISNVASSPYLQSYVVISPQPPLYKTNRNSIAAGSNDIPLFGDLQNAMELIAENNLAGARTICLNLITNYPDYSVSYNALNLLKDTYTANEISNSKGMYKSLFNAQGKKNLYAMAGLILADIDKENKLNLIDNVINSYKNESVVELALFDKFVCYYFEKADKPNAIAISQELDKQFPLSQGAIEAHRILGDKGYDSVSVIQEQALQKTIVQTPIKYSLGNYPNPFNPTTVISYQLPNDAKVTLNVFDILGREIVTLVDGEVVTGNHTATFDGSRLSSGIYFVRLTAIPQDASTPITKTMKMLMMK